MTKLTSTACIAALTVALLGTAALAGAGEKSHHHDAPAASQETQSSQGHGGHGDHGDMNPAVGEKGDPANARRTLRVTMTDNKYEPKSIAVQAGETVRFTVENKGEFVHEFNIGTAEMHKNHQAEMMKMMQSGALESDHIVHAKMGAMMHDDANAVLLEPGQTGEIIWKFGASGEIQFACNVPGHYDDGMHGRLNVR
jgi:uncharacterized cupredoxin-like copper-binding protein